MSGTTMSTPSNSDSGNMSPASITMMSSCQRMAMQFIPNSPRPPSGITWSFPLDINSDASTASGALLSVITGVTEFLKTICYRGISRDSIGPILWQSMATFDPKNSSWVTAKVESALHKAYATIRVEPDEYLTHLRAAHGLPVNTYDGMFTVPVEQLDAIAQQAIRASMKIAATGGAGFGLGGLLTVVPDVSVLSAITMRTIQKLSLIYGFQY